MSNLWSPVTPVNTDFPEVSSTNKTQWKERNDRQLRLWGIHGQSRIDAANVLLLNASSVWVAASDAKRKRNFEPYTNGLSAILGLNPKLYNMDFQKDGDEKQVGLVAQEVNPLIPKAYNDNNGFIGLDYNAITVTLINAIKELNDKIKLLENK
jgi:hypothetical protein